MRATTSLLLLVTSMTTSCNNSPNPPDAGKPDTLAVRDGARDGMTADRGIRDSSTSLDCGPPVGPTPTLSCDPKTSSDAVLCDCLAGVLCKKIQNCLSPCVIAAKPAGCHWAPVSDCSAKLASDCKDDLKSGYKPVSFSSCVQDVFARPCADYHNFSTLAGDLPASCAGLKATDSALCIH